MPPQEPLSEQLAAIEGGRAFIELSRLRTIRITGQDARGWLHDLVTTDVASLVPGQARRSLLLTPTGRIRADFSVGCHEDGFWMLQPDDQPDPLDHLLARYVLSSAVELDDATGRVRVVGVLIPAHASPPASERLTGPGFAPSIVGTGVDIVTARNDLDRPVDGEIEGLTEVAEETVDIWRVRRGVARMGRDFKPGSLPSEAGLEGTIDATKGCFLGQESVAKIRNLGHPPTALMHVRCAGALRPGAPIFADGPPQVGEVTSAAPDRKNGTIALARIRWDARLERLTSGEGVELVTVGSTD